MTPLQQKQVICAVLLAALLVWLFMGSPQPATLGHFKAQPWAVGAFLLASYFLLRGGL